MKRQREFLIKRQILDEKDCECLLEKESERERSKEKENIGKRK
jgi:hypothetical protein